jgi:hypothetical protein
MHLKDSEYQIASSNMVHQYVRDNGHEFIIIQVNIMVKKIYDYVMMGLESNDCFVIRASCLNGVTVMVLLVACAT